MDMQTFLHRTSHKQIVRRVPMATISQMVVEALKILKHPNGCTMQQIRYYVNAMLSGDDDAELVLDKIPQALQRGVRFGAIKQYGEHFKLDAIMVLASKGVRHAQGEPVDTKPFPMRNKRRKEAGTLSKRQQKLQTATLFN